MPLFGFGYSASSTLTQASIPANSGGASDADAQAFITAASITDSTQISAIDQLVIDLKGYGVWDKSKAIYPVVGGSASSHAVNLKTPGTFNLTFSTGWTHASTGMTPNGTSAYANTGINTANNLAINSAHLSFYSRTDQTAGTIAEIGSLKTTPDSFSDLQLKSASGAIIRINNTTAFNSAANSDSKGFYVGSRTANTTIKLFKNGSSLINGTASSNATSTVNFLISAQNNNGTPQSYSQKECAFASLGDGLTDTEMTNFNTAVQNFNITLSRNV